MQEAAPEEAVLATSHTPVVVAAPDALAPVPARKRTWTRRRWPQDSCMQFCLICMEPPASARRRESSQCIVLESVGTGHQRAPFDSYAG